MAPTCFGLQPSSGSLQLSQAERVVCCAERDLFPLCTALNAHAILGHAATQPHNQLRRNLTECYNINITLARLNCKLPDDGRRPKHVGTIEFNVNCNQRLINVHLLVNELCKYI